MFATRLCWNSKCWSVPTGEAHRIESGTYPAKRGFGHEEWLFHPGWVIDGWCYAWIQGLLGTRKINYGDKLDLSLFTIQPNRGRVWVGRIRSATYLDRDSDHAKSAVREYHRAGYLAQMQREMHQVRMRGGSRGRFLETDLYFNLRFRPAAAELYADPFPLIRKGHYLRRCHRVGLFAIGGAAPCRSSSGVTSKNLKRVRGRRRAGRFEYDPVHNRMQAALFDWLCKKHGKHCVHMERDRVDICVTSDGAHHVIEVKSDPDATSAIRNAIGQLLLYAHKLDDRNAVLHVVSQGELNPEAASYLEYISMRGLKVNYHTFDPALRQFPLGST